MPPDGRRVRSVRPWTIGLFRIMLQMWTGLVLPYVQLGGGLLTTVVPMFANVIWHVGLIRLPLMGPWLPADRICRRQQAQVSGVLIGEDEPARADWVCT